jgi:hypothetical protein
LWRIQKRWWVSFVKKIFQSARNTTTPDANGAHCRVRARAD